jgi:hypothetical protein
MGGANGGSCFSPQLHRAQELAFSQARALWARHGLTPAEFDVLATLRNASPP